MQFDVRQITAAANQLRSAVRYADGAKHMPVPLLGGRGAAIDVVRSHLGTAAEWADGVAVPLARYDGPVGDARVAAERLSSKLHEIRDVRGVRGRLYELDGPVGAARDAVRLLDAVSAALRMPADELLPHVRSRIDETKSSWLAKDQIRAIGEARFDDLGDAAPFVAEAGRSNQVPFMLQHALGEEPDLWNAFQSLVSHGYSEPVHIRNVRTAWRSTAATFGGDIDARMPSWLSEADGTELRKIRVAEADELLLSARAATRDDAARYLLERWATNRSSERDVNVLVAATRLPEPVRVDVSIEGADLAALASGPSIPKALVPAIDDAFARVAASSDAVLADQLALLRQDSTNVRAQTVFMARIGHVRPDAVLGGEAANQPWALELLDQAFVPKVSNETLRAIRSTFEFVRRTGGDRGRLLDELDALTRLAATDRSHATLEAGYALRVLPDEARPASAALVQKTLDAAFSGSNSITASTQSSNALERARRTIGVIVEAERLAADPAATRAAVAAEMDAILARPDTEISDDVLRRLTVLAHAPVDGSVPDTATGLLAIHAGQERDLAWQLGALRMDRAGARLGEDPAVTRATVAGELRTLLERPTAELTVGEVRRILALAAAPDHLQPWSGVAPITTFSKQGLIGAGKIAYDTTDLRTVASLPSTATNEIARLRMGLERLDLVDSGVTSATVRGELRQLVDTSIEQLGTDQQRRLALLDGLPDAQHGMAGQRFGLADSWDAQMGSTANTAFRRGIESMRLQFDALDEVAGGATRESVTAEAQRLLATRELPAETHRRVALLAAMPPDVRPPMTDETSRAVVTAFLGSRLGRSGEPTLATLRAELFAAAPLPLTDALDIARVGDTGLDLRRLQPAARGAVSDASLDALRAAGTSHRGIASDILETTRGSGSRVDITDATNLALPFARRIADEPGLGGGERQVADRLVELLTRNRDRATGALHDGYGSHPDYAEHGRAIEQAKLLAGMEALRDQRPDVKFAMDSMGRDTSVTSIDLPPEYLTW